MLVSVIIPVCNCERFLRAALASILRETSVPIEVIVSDDGSSDRSREVARSVGDPRVKLIDGPCRGIAANFNAAFEASSGDIVMRCDADDIYPEGRIAHQVELLATNLNHGAVCGSFAAMRGWLKVPLTCAGKASRDITDDLSTGVVETCFNTFAVRREALIRVGGANEDYRTAEDIDLQLRLSEVCSIRYFPEVAYYWRLSDTSITHTSSSQSKAFFEQKARDDQAARSGRTIAPAPTNHDTLASDEHLQRLLIGAAWSSLTRSARIKNSVMAILAKPSSGWVNLAAAISKPVK